MALSDDQCRDILTDLDEHDLKTSVAIIRANIYFRRWGSMPFDERTVCSITKVTPKFYRERLWPVIETRLDVSEDGRRLSNPDIASNRRARPSIQRPESAAEKSPRHQMAANKRWAHGDVHEGGPAPKDPPPTHPVASEDASSLHTTDASGDAKTHAKSTTDAYGFASDVHNLASVASPAPSLSLSEASLTESLKKADPIEGERESAPASAQAGADATVDAKHASGDAPGDAKLHAPADAKPAASIPVKPKAVRPAKTYLPPDWQPRADIAAEIETRGMDPQDIATMFCAFSVADGSEWEDWDAAFALWWARERKAPKNREMGWMQPVRDGVKPDPAKQATEATELEAETVACTGTGPGPTFARVVRALKKDMNATEHRTLFAKVRLGWIEGDEACITGDSQWVCDHVRTTFGDRLRDGIHRDYPAIKRLVFQVAEPAETRHRA